MKKTTMGSDAAEAMAAQALQFIASEPELMRRFLGISGIDPSDIRRAAQEPGFLAGVLQFIVAHEPTLLAFAQAADIAPETVAMALRALPFGDDSPAGAT